MTATDPFTTPAEAERAARVKQAQDLLSGAAGMKDLSTYNYDTGRRSYKGGVEAIRDALVGQGHAMLAVRDELADIAESLRTLAAAPSVLGQIADGLTELGNVADDVHTAIEVHGETVTDVLSNVAEQIDRPRWWQFRLRRVLRQETAEADIAP